MSDDAIMEALGKLRKENEQLRKENEELKKQQQQGSSGQSGQSAPPPEKQAVKLTASGTKGKIASLAGGQGKARLLDKDGTPIEGETIVFEVDGREVGSGTTDANGEATVQSGQYAGDPQMWIQAIGNGYTAVYNGSKKYKPARANAQVGVGIT
ncbi:Ig-like domain-containing protein [Streptomyces sp. NPDC001339]|uniref:Ig-like domain-containing protein n=1 Tax=Streptomyces sp. NPDC001339 TaxID=3364563 RepID=UPI003678F0FD